MSTPGERIAAGDPYDEFTPAVSPERLRKLILHDIEEERARQIAKFGDQSHLPDGTLHEFESLRDLYRHLCQTAFRNGRGTWLHVLREEVFEAFAEWLNPRALRKELIQCAAVIVAWVEALDQRARQTPEVPA